MNSHLSADQICERAAGSRSLDIERHLSGCPACQAEVSRFESALGQFGDSVRERSGEQFNRHAVTAEKLQARAIWRNWQWALVAVVMALFIGVSVHNRMTLVSAPVGNELSDAALLQQVSQQVEQTVPGPMEPLTKLVSWNEGGTR